MDKDDQRFNILNLLDLYSPSDPIECISKQKIIDFVKSNPECFNNNFVLGHVTGSALVVDKKIEFALLTHHKKLDKWLQFGGHSDGLPDVFQTARREAFEESGLLDLEPIAGHEAIFDLDVHEIPAKGEIPKHFHYDVRIILSTDMGSQFKVSDESKEIKWIKLTEVYKFNNTQSVLRLVNKAMDLSKN